MNKYLDIKHEQNYHQGEESKRFKYIELNDI